MAPPLPANSDERIFHLKHAKPEFVESRGPGGRGKPLAIFFRLLRRFLRKKSLELFVKHPSAPHPPSPSPREFGFSLIEFQVARPNSRGEGGPYFIFKNLKWVPLRW